MIIFDVLQSIAHSCRECAKALDTDLAGATTATETTKKVIKRFFTFNRIPALLAEIRHKAEQLQKIHNAVNALLLQDIKTQQEIIKSTLAMNKPAIQQHLLDLGLSTNFASIDQIVGSLMKEYKHLQQRLQEAILFPDTLVVQQHQEQNPEGASFWKDRFQKDELSASAPRYEVRTLKAPYSQYRRIMLTFYFLDRHYTFLGHASYMR